MPLDVNCRSITTSYYRNSVGALLVYDVTNRNSFEHVAEWLDEIKRHIQPRCALCILVGHKCDMENERVISQREGRQFAEFHGLGFIETSAKTGQNIEDAFLAVTKDIYEQLNTGSLHVEDGWEGVKKGYSCPKEAFHINTQPPSLGSKCC